MSEVTVLALAPEIFPLIKTGGLADVAGALAGALAAEGVAVVTLVPGGGDEQNQRRRAGADGPRLIWWRC